MAEHDYDVIIAGGGPTGITLAGLLALRGVSVLVVEQDPAIYPLPRAAHVDHETMRLFQDMGAAEAIIASCRSGGAYEFRNARGKVLMRFDGTGEIGAGGWPVANMVHQPSIETALRAQLAELPLADLRVATTLTGWRDTGEAVVATIRDDHGERAVRARYLVGADGARSPVRKAAQIVFDDLGFEEPWLVVDVLVHDPARLPQVNLQICDPARPTTCVQMGAGRHRWEFMIKPGEDPADISSDAGIARLLAPWQVDGAVTMERKAVYTFRARVARQWRCGRVLLAGDAAHQTPPFAGQGLCAGIRDAANLAWKLAAIIRDGAAPHVLDAYQAEREPHVRATITMAIMMGRMVCTISPLAAFIRDCKIGLARRMGALPDGPPAYPPITGGLILSGAPAAGAYFPQLCGDAERSDTLLGAGPWLIMRGAPIPTGAGLRAISINAPAMAPFRDGFDRWLAGYGCAAVLVRPDHTVFAAGDPADLAAQWRHALGFG